MVTCTAYFISSASGKSQKTGNDYFQTTLNIEVVKDEKTSNFMLTFFIDAEVYIKIKNCKKFQPLDAVFIPNAKGNAQLVDITLL